MTTQRHGRRAGLALARAVVRAVDAGSTLLLRRRLLALNTQRRGGLAENGLGVVGETDGAEDAGRGI